MLDPLRKFSQSRSIHSFHPLQLIILKKHIVIFSGIAAVLTALSIPAHAGTLTHDFGPSFLPSSSFTDNSIEAVHLRNPPGFMGDVVRLFGDSQVAPAAQAPRILLGGTYDAQAGDNFSIAYNFTINLATPDPITITLQAQAMVMGNPEMFSAQITINPGIGHYQGEIPGITFALATSGTWKGQMSFNFTTPSGSTENPNPGGALVKIKAIDFRLTAVPEPSSWILFGTGLAGLTFWIRRRQRA